MSKPITPRPTCFNPSKLGNVAKTLLVPLMLMVAALPTAQAIQWTKPFQDEFPPDFPTLDQLSITTLEGKTIPGEELLGQVVAFVVFLPSCPKCTGKLPKIEAARHTFEAEGITVVGVAANNSSSGLSRWEHQGDYGKWLWAGNSYEVRRQLGSSRDFEIYLFDRAGEIAYLFKQTDALWKLHFEIGVGAVTERALDLSEVEPQGYTGSMICGMCHQAEFDQWAQTAHAHSYETLIQDNASQSLECITCHVTGEAGKETRPWRILQKELQEVGCEECHGPGGPHRLTDHPNKGLYSTEESSCIRCHDQENSPNFNYADYLKMVVHDPDSGVPAEPSEGTVEESTEERKE